MRNGEEELVVQALLTYVVPKSAPRKAPERPENEASFLVPRGCSPLTLPTLGQICLPRFVLRFNRLLNEIYPMGSVDRSLRVAWGDKR
jgi:hypothetical protein